MLETPTAPLPAGFRANVENGLIVPEPESRTRQVWTKAEWALLERTTKMLNRHGVALIMRCTHDTCKEGPLEGERLRDGSFRLRCNHCDRVMVRAF